MIPPQAVADFVAKLPVRKLFGVGPVLEKRLQDLNLHTCADLQKLPLETLASRFGSMGERLYQLCRGIDERPVNPERIRKSISVEMTYPYNLGTSQACIEKLPELVTKLQQRIARAGDIAPIHNLFVKLKFNDFQQTTVETLAETVSIETLQTLLEEAWARGEKPVRLIGIGLRLRHPHKKVLTQLKLPF